MIAVVKDTLIYITVLAMVIVIPIELGGFGEIFASVPASKILLTPPSEGTLGQFSAYATLALGSAFALFLYPHTMTGVLSATSRDVIRRNAAYLPAYSFLLRLLALTGSRRSPRASTGCPNSHRSSRNTNRTSRSPRSFCIHFQTGLRASPLQRSGSAGSSRLRSCRSLRRTC